MWVLTAPPKAELVGEGERSHQLRQHMQLRQLIRLKLQVTMSFSQEVQWADEDVQIGVLQDLASNAGIVLKST